MAHKHSGEIEALPVSLSEEQIKNLAAYKNELLKELSDASEPSTPDS